LAKKINKKHFRYPFVFFESECNYDFAFKLIYISALIGMKKRKFIKKKNKSFFCPIMGNTHYKKL